MDGLKKVLNESGVSYPALYPVSTVHLTVDRGTANVGMISLYPVSGVLNPLRLLGLIWPPLLLGFVHHEQTALVLDLEQRWLVVNTGHQVSNTAIAGSTMNHVRSELLFTTTGSHGQRARACRRRFRRPRRGGSLSRSRGRLARRGRFLGRRRRRAGTCRATAPGGK